MTARAFPIAACAAWTFAASHAWAQSPGTLALRDAVRMALEKNKSIEASSAAEEGAAARVAEARAGALPRLHYAESWTRSDNPVFVFGSLLTQRRFGPGNFAVESLNRPDFLNNFQSTIAADQPVYDAGRTRRAVELANRGRETAALETKKVHMDVIAGVVRAYAAAAFAEESLHATAQAVRAAEADLLRAEARKESGFATDADVLSMRVQLASVRELRIRRQADLDAAFAAVNDAIGLPVDSPPLRLETALSSTAAMPAEQVITASARPEIAQMAAARAMEEIRVSEARAQRLPQVVVHAAFEANRQRFATRGGANWLVSAGLRWNLFDGNAAKSGVRAAQAAVKRASAEEARTASAMLLQVRRAEADLKAASQRIETLQATVVEAEESLRITRNRYEAGLQAVSDLLRAEAAVLETKVRYLGSLHDRRVAAAMLELAAGTLHADSEVLR